MSELCNTLKVSAVKSRSLSSSSKMFRPVPATLQMSTPWGSMRVPEAQNMKRTNQIISIDGPESLLILKFNPDTVKNDGEEGKTNKEMRY